MSSGTSFLIAFVAQWYVALGDDGEGLDLVQTRASVVDAPMEARTQDTVSVLQTRAAQVTGEFEDVDFVSLLQTRAARVTGEFEGVDFSKKEEEGGVLRSQVPLDEDDHEGETLALEGDDREGALMEKGKGDDDQTEATLLLQAVEADVEGAEVLKNLKEDGVSDSQINAVALDCVNDETVITADGMAKILVTEGFDVLQSADVMLHLNGLAIVTHKYLGAATTLIQKSVTLDQTITGKCNSGCRAAQANARASAIARRNAARQAAMAAARQARQQLMERRLLEMEEMKADCLAAALDAAHFNAHFNLVGTCVKWDNSIRYYSRR